jgi:aldehyde:ferredoxin oxidoreductase
MECYDKGIITKEQTGGLELKFGDADAMLKALELTVRAEGPLGRALSQGSERAARNWGKAAQECLITVKGAEAPAHMPQAKRSLALIYAVNPFGADHQSSEHDWMIEEGMASDLYMERQALLGMPNMLPALSLGPEKVRFAYLTEIFYSMLDSVELCQFVFGPAWTLYGPAETVEMVRAVTGWDVTVEELMAVGERRLNLMRTFNAREGLDRTQDKLPKKFFKTLGGVGPTAGMALDEKEVKAAVDEYYRLAHWTDKGIPTAARLKKLDIGWAAAYLPA